MSIHASAIVHPNAELEADVEVQAFAIIGEHVRIGPGTVVGPHCVIDGRTEIGPGNRIYSGAQIGVPSQDRKHGEGLTGRTVIGGGNLIREHVVISACTLAGDESDRDRATVIGNGCMFMAFSHVAHDCRVGNGVILANCAALAGHVTVEDEAVVGGLSGVHQECAIGALAFVGGVTAVRKDVPPYMIVDGVPARCSGPNAVGLQRHGFDAQARARVKAMYRIMYRSGLNTTQALERIEAAVEDSAERKHFLAFVRASVRGITR